MRRRSLFAFVFYGRSLFVVVFYYSAVISTRFDSEFEGLPPERDAILTFYASREQPLLSPNRDFFRASTEAGQRAARDLTHFTGSLALREAGLISRFSL